MAQTKETLRPIPTTHVSAVAEAASWATPLTVYMACRRTGDFVANPEAPEREMKPSLRRWASRVLGRTFYVQRGPARAGGRLACLAAFVDGVTAEGDSALLLRLPKEDTAEAWRRAVKTHDMPLADRVEATAVRMLLGDGVKVSVAVLLDGRMHVMHHQPVEQLERQVGALVFGFWQNVAKGAMPMPRENDGDALRRLYPSGMQAHLKWSQLSLEQRAIVEAWALANNAMLDSEKVEKGAKARVMALIGEATGIDLAGAGARGHWIERVDFMNKAPAAHAGVWKAIAETYLKKLKPRSRERLMARHMPVTGARVLNWYEGTGRVPGTLGGRIDSPEQRGAAVEALAQLQEKNPSAGSPDFKLLGDLQAELKAFDDKVRAGLVQP